MQAIIDRGDQAFANRTNRTHTIGAIVADFDAHVATGQTIVLSGRLMVIRGSGAIVFGVLADGTGELQIVVKKDVAEAMHSDFVANVDAGDFVECQGTLFVTDRGQQSLLVNAWHMLTKTLLPLPEKWHGIVDEDERLRKRYLDILTNKELQELFVKKARFWQVMRRFLEDEGFLAVDTPTLEVTTGGAEADPFATHHNDFDIPVYLRISIGELWQKRLMASGFARTYEIGRAYRNEGSSPHHLQEFTNMEFYMAYADYVAGMKLVQRLYRMLATEVFGRTAFTKGEYAFDFADEWQTIDYVATIKSGTGIDIWTATEQDMVATLKQLGVTFDAKTRERLVDNLWKYCRKQIAGPTFVIGYPDFIQPLAKRSASDSRIVEQFQVVIAGTEVGKGYSELNDPIDQRARFAHQQDLRAQGDKEAMMPDWEFVEMLEHGMPPTCGFGVGERLFAILADKPIRETQLFPLVKPKSQE